MEIESNRLASRALAASWLGIASPQPTTHKSIDRGKVHGFTSSNVDYRLHNSKAGLGFVTRVKIPSEMDANEKHVLELFQAKSRSQLAEERRHRDVKDGLLDDLSDDSSEDAACIRGVKALSRNSSVVSGKLSLEDIREKLIQETAQKRNISISRRERRKRSKKAHQSSVSST